jgi:hypothetical protein
MATQTTQSVPIHLYDSNAPSCSTLKEVSQLWEAKVQGGKTPSCQVIDEPCPNDLTTPITVGPNGSGYKGTGKSHEEYARDADIYGYQGSYNPQNQRQRQPTRLPGNPGPSNGGFGGGGGGHGPTGGGLNTVPQAAPHRNDGEFYDEWKWTCVSFHQDALNLVLC